MEHTELGKYRHYKGRDYELIAVAKHSETLENMAFYRQLYGDGSFWVRPLNMFLEKVLVEGTLISRFEKIQD